MVRNVVSSLLSLAVKEFQKSVKICQSYCNPARFNLIKMCIMYIRLNEYRAACLFDSQRMRYAQSVKLSFYLNWAVS